MPLVSMFVYACKEDGRRSWKLGQSVSALAPEFLEGQRGFNGEKVASESFSDKMTHVNVQNVES